jgi:hypothetical protein
MSSRPGARCGSHQGQEPADQQTNGICERFHRTVLDEFYRVSFRKKIYRTIDELQVDLDAWIAEYNTMSYARIRAAGVSAKPRCRPSLTRSPWRRRNSWPLDHQRQPHLLKQVRSGLS